MSYPNSGSIAKNDKGDNPKRPDYKGSCEVDGVAYWIAAWVKKGDKGPFLSLSFDPKEKKAEKPPATTGDFDLGNDDEIPF
jgi:hypothetical protein